VTKNKFLSLIEKLKNFAKRKETLRILTVLSLLYTLLLLFLSRKEISLIDWDKSLPVFFQVFLLYFSSHLIQNLAFSILLERNLNNFIENSQIYFETILMKRMPGGFWHWIGRSQFVHNSDRIDRNIGSANFFEFVLLLLSGISLYIGSHNVIGGLLFCIISIFLSQFSDWIFPKFGKLNIFQTIVVWGLFCIAWLSGALKFQLLVNLISPNAITFSNSLPIWTLATTVSMITSFFPNMGLFRDFTITSLMRETINLEKIMLINAEMRVLFLSFDLLSALIVILLINLFKKKTKSG